MGINGTLWPGIVTGRASHMQGYCLLMVYNFFSIWLENRAVTERRRTDVEQTLRDHTLTVCVLFSSNFIVELNEVQIAAILYQLLQGMVLAIE